MKDIIDGAARKFVTGTIVAKARLDGGNLARQCLGIGRGGDGAESLAQTLSAATQQRFSMRRMCWLH